MTRFTSYTYGAVLIALLTVLQGSYKNLLQKNIFPKHCPNFFLQNTFLKC